MTAKRSVIFATPIRTAIGAFGGSLRELPAPDLGRRDPTSNPASHHSNNRLADSQSKTE